MTTGWDEPNSGTTRPRPIQAPSPCPDDRGMRGSPPSSRTGDRHIDRDSHRTARHIPTRPADACLPLAVVLSIEMGQAFPITVQPISEGKKTAATPIRPHGSNRRGRVGLLCSHTTAGVSRRPVPHRLTHPRTKCRRTGPPENSRCSCWSGAPSGDSGHPHRL